MNVELKPCPFCGHSKSMLMSKVEHSPNKEGLKAFEWIPSTEFGGGYESEIDMCDFRYAFYRRCTKCGARSPLVKTPWHIRTEDEADSWTRDSKYFGFEASSAWAEPTRDKADEAWNTRYERTCEVVSHETNFGGFGCEEAGEEWTLSCGHMVINYSDYPSNYCDECGAKVVGE